MSPRRPCPPGSPSGSASAARKSPARILRKSLDARNHDDLHFVYAAEVELPGDEADLIRRGARTDVEPFEDEGFDWPAPGAEPIEHVR